MSAFPVTLTEDSPGPETQQFVKHILQRRWAVPEDRAVRLVEPFYHPGGGLMDIGVEELIAPPYNLEQRYARSIVKHAQEAKEADERKRKRLNLNFNPMMMNTQEPVDFDGFGLTSFENPIGQLPQLPPTPRNPFNSSIVVCDDEEDTLITDASSSNNEQQCPPLDMAVPSVQSLPSEESDAQVDADDGSSDSDVIILDAKMGEPSFNHNSGEHKQRQSCDMNPKVAADSDSEKEWEFRRILGAKRDQETKKVLFRIEWGGDFPPDYQTFEYFKETSACREFLAKHVVAGVWKDVDRSLNGKNFCGLCGFSGKLSSQSHECYRGYTQCETCKKQFEKESEVRVHEAMCSGEKYIFGNQCRFCSETFPTSVDRRNHLQTCEARSE